MKKIISLFLSITLLFMCALAGIPVTYASSKASEPRAIAIVFDNSGSMYEAGNQAWCRATYAMEVFASMLNAGDVLQIYPMHPITVDSQEYSMENPLRITDSSQAPLIRDIYTSYAGGTPIESIDYAIDGLQSMQSQKKYLVILTDGGNFSKGGGNMSKTKTKAALDSLFQATADNTMTVLYLGIGADACVPDTRETNYFVKRQAINTADVLSTLTEMCNLIFGRDILPKSRISGQSMDFDIAMSKLIVFVQGQNISGLDVKPASGGSAGRLANSQQTKYSTKGAADYVCEADSSLQGMIVVYEDCPAGCYTIGYSGTATSVEVYYEPDADLDFVFTDSEGNNVDSTALYEGDYKVSFGMKDAKTGKLIASDLLGNPHYEGSYFVNGKETKITHNGYSGEVPISLKMNDTFSANLTVTYLSGYTISKDSSDFGWSDDGIRISARPAGNLRLEITGGDEVNSIQTLEDGTPYIAKVYYQDTLLTGDELKSVNLQWDEDTSHAKIVSDFADDHYVLRLRYKNPSMPLDTVYGKCSVPIRASYTAKGSNEARTEALLTYSIDEDLSSIQLSLSVPEDYIVISKLGNSKAITVRLTLNGQLLTEEDFDLIDFRADCGGIAYTLTRDVQNSGYTIKLQETDGIKEGKYLIYASASMTDHIGRKIEAKDESKVTLSTMPLWVKWLIALAIITILFIIIWSILHIKVLPRNVKTRNSDTLIYDGDDVTQSSSLRATIEKQSARFSAGYGGKTFGLSMDVSPGKDSYLYKSQKRRSAIVKTASVKKFGPARIQEAMIGSTKYVEDDTTGKLVPALPNQKPVLMNGMIVKYSGTIQDSGVDKDFEVTSRLNFKKK